LRPRLTNMTAALVVGVTVAVGIASAAGAYLYSVHHFQTLLDTARATALAEGDLIRVALEHQMIENDRTLIDRMIRSFGNAPEVESVMLLDRQGRVRYSSSPDTTEAELHIDSPTCQACHRHPPPDRASSRVIETHEGSLFRTVIPVRNRVACHRCHDPSHQINGILIVDRDAGAIRAGMDRDLVWLTAGTGGLALLLITAIAWILRAVVMRRLQRFETTARQIAAGDLNQRVPAEGTDTVAWLGREFNTMADAMTKLIRNVKSQQEQLETVINGIEDGIVVLDRDRRVLAANDSFLRRAGRSRGEIVGTSCHEATSTMCGGADCPTEACLAGGRSQVRICERKSAEGGTVWEEVHASPIRDPSGKVRQVVEVWRDISRRREAEARLAESHRLASLGMLASGFSHELNTPLGTVLTCVEGIQRSIRSKDDVADPELRRAAENAAIAREQLLRCRGITQHFLRLSRGQRGPEGLVAVAETIEAVVRLVEPTARSRSVAIRIGAVDRHLRVQVNEAELQHVLVNLMLNAVQACAGGGTVTLAAENGPEIVIGVSDDGCGIPPETMTRIFDPFFSGRPGGTGLGLFLSLDFVRGWGGQIRVRSELGKGSTFEIVVPASERLLRIQDRAS